MNDYEQIGIDTYELAEQIFGLCGAPNDFCHQSELTFGGTNRITLTQWGWQASESHCTAQFLSKFKYLQYGGQ